MIDITEKLAELIHDQWRNGAWTKQYHLDVPYAKLPLTDKEENRAAARRIADVLALVRLGIATVEQAKLMKQPGTRDIELAIEAQLERLAQAEHDAWMAN